MSDNEYDPDDPDDEHGLGPDVEVAIESEEPEITDGPDYMFEEGEVSSKDQSYVFCPKAHRKGILRLVTKHFVRHPFFPDRNGKCSTAPEIRRQAVAEMYQYCHLRNLREVWGYMWANWYCTKKWALWARSSDPERLSRLRTTMTVENHWKRIKHVHLHNLTHPRLDQLVYILIYRVTPAINARLENLDSLHHLGRARAPTTLQVAFKKSWTGLAKRGIRRTDYEIDIEQWTCSCGHQKYNPHHLCKHLVQAVPPPSADFWVEVIRRRTKPLYRHPELRPINQPRGSFDDYDDGSITDGDDQVWTGSKSMLSAGRWRELTNDTVLGKRTRQDSNIGPEVSQVPRTHVDVDAPSTQRAALRDAEEGLEEQEEDARREQLRELARKLRMGADMIEEQVEYGTPIWTASILRRSIGHDVVDMVDDILRERGSHRRRETTWAHPGDQVEARRRANTMGYVVLDD
ncbi:hypothetical protein GGX14DRAFT_449176 [Mycena pura]|uniref:SWIM-type domain-containing protein n=1 Tax=Mycena pura TaxID=153505 RepID=A0AAD6Y2N0_9AGAR|nr:hypothetical protein GGX14DRAFT_477907 [Mycena pura]KAJ7198182.1 hypothetical protein GGX14DRAFT_470455 [Mycena pura]KAJ7211142.1 hypothetical protein GGX14DRAFT_449176 [Mycena pura]